jgi:glutaminyl-tRNA synthetase
VIRCDDVVKDDSGTVVELHCSYDPGTRSGNAGRKVAGTIHWVSAPHALAAEVRLFGRLFTGDTEPEIDEHGALIDPHLAADSLTVLRGAWIEPSVAGDDVGTRYQFERNGYFWRDPVDGSRTKLVFNRIVSLKDTWAKRDTENVVATKPTRAPARAKAPSRATPRPRVQDPAVAARVARYRDELGILAEHAEVLAGAADFFEAALAEHGNAPDVGSWIAVDLRGLLEGRAFGELPFDGAALGRLAGLVGGGRLSRRAGKDVLARMAREGGDPERLVDEMGLAKVSDPKELGAAVDAVLARWPERWPSSAGESRASSVSFSAR